MLQRQSLKMAECAAPALPDGYQRGDVIRVVSQVAPVLQLSAGVLRTLINMIHTTRPLDWTGGKTIPLCYREQIKIAEASGQTPRTIRNHEAVLVSRGLIEKTTGADGSRGRFGGGKLVLGISFRPLIERFDELLSIAKQLDEKCLAREIARRKLSAARRQLAKQIALNLEQDKTYQPELEQAIALRATLPARYDEIDLPTLEHLAESVDNSLRNLAESSLNSKEISGAPEKTTPRHIQATTEPLHMSCNDNANTEPHPETTDTQSERTSRAQPKKCLEKKGGVVSPGRNTKITESFSPRQLYAMASNEMQLYLDGRADRRNAQQHTEHDFIQAAIAILRDRGIHPTAWDEAVDAMGEFAAAVSILVIDANITHPVKPIHSPGATLRTFARLAKLGKLNLYGSLIGLKYRKITN